jgi:hypothetical protein
VLKQYNNSLYQALIGVYPNIGLKVESFDKFPGKYILNIKIYINTNTFFFFFSFFFEVNYWKDPTNRKLFFDNFAAEQKFDPLKPSNWYGITQKAILEQKVTRTR